MDDLLRQLAGEGIDLSDLPDSDTDDDDAEARVLFLARFNQGRTELPGLFTRETAMEYANRDHTRGDDFNGVPWFVGFDRR